MYAILTEKTKNRRDLPVDEKKWWSHIYGCFSSFEQATRFDDFESTQPTVRRLRAGSGHYIYAVEVERCHK